jgi:hypothetical protein
LQRALCQVKQCDEAAINNDCSNHHLMKARGAIRLKWLVA